MSMSREGCRAHWTQIVLSITERDAFIARETTPARTLSPITDDHNMLSEWAEYAREWFYSGIPSFQSFCESGALSSLVTGIAVGQLPRRMARIGIELGEIDWDGLFTNIAGAHRRIFRIHTEWDPEPGNDTPGKSVVEIHEGIRMDEAGRLDGARVTEIECERPPEEVWVNIYSLSHRWVREEGSRESWRRSVWTLQESYSSPPDMAERARAEALSDFPEVLHGLVWPGAREYKVAIEREAGQSATVIKEPQSNE